MLQKVSYKGDAGMNDRAFCISYSLLNQHVTS